MIRFSLLPYQSFNDYEDLTNEEFLNRIQEPIDGEMIAVSIICSIEKRPKISTRYVQVQFYNKDDALIFHSVSDSLAISYDGGIVYEPMSNKTVIKVVIEHEKGYSTGNVTTDNLYENLIILCKFELTSFDLA